MARDEHLGRAFVELADTLVEGYDVIEFLHLLTERCVSLLGVAEAGVVLADARGEVRALGSSSERMRLMELIELQRRDGPYLDCWQHGGKVREDDLEANVGRWPHFGPAAVSAGFRSAYALPLRLRNERIGALNLLADRPAGLAEADEALGQALADVATIGILHERVVRERKSLAEQLQVALDSRVALEQAKGVVAEQAGVDMDEAFRLLRRHARHHNRRLSEVVAAVVNRELSATDLRVTRRTPGTRPREQIGRSR